METRTGADKKPAAKKKILLIDDESDFAYYTKKHLENTKEFEVAVEDNAVNGIKLAVEQKPDLILLDIMMPKMDGLKALTILKNNEQTRSIPIIMLTAKGDIGSISEAQSSLAADYIIKPFEPKQLLDLVRMYLGMSRDE